MMKDKDSILVDMDSIDFKLAFKAALIFTLGQSQPLVSALIKEADLKHSISAAARQLNSDEKELKNAKKEIKELRRSLENERRRSNGLEDELEDSGKAYAELRDSTDAYCEEKDDLRDRLDHEIDQCRETMRALRESEARTRGAERELAELRIGHAALLKKHEKIMSILNSDEEDDIPPEEEDEEFEETRTVSEVPLTGKAEEDNSKSNAENGRTSPASDMSLSDDEHESEVSSTLTGSFARISLRSSPSTAATSESDDSEEEETSPVFLREMAQQHKICSDNFLDRARSAEKWGDPIAAERRRTEAEQYAKLAQHYHKLAATKVFHRNNPHLHNGAFVAEFKKGGAGARNPTHIDVHHLLRQEALDYVQAHIDLCKSIGLENTIVICGRGNHSARGSPVLRNAILDDLDKLSHKGLRASVQENNPGRISVRWTLDA